MSTFAFFDLDRTILKINSGEALLRRAHKNGILSNYKFISAYYLSILHKLRLIDSARLIEKFTAWLANYSVNTIESLCLEILEKDLIPAIRPQINVELKRHKEQGANVVLLSSSLSSICSPLAKYLEIPTVICTELEVQNEVYSGLPKGDFCFREEKLNRMIRILATNNSAIEDAFYYGDSIDDLPVLQSVGFPVCVNPDVKLKKIARQHHWEIHLWN